MPSETSNSTVVLSDAYSAGILFDLPVEASSLSVSSFVTAVFGLHGIADSVLGMSSSIHGAPTIAAGVSSVLRVSDTSGSESPLRVQYAVNAATGAVSEYSGYEFEYFARCGQRSFACTPTGVFELGGHTDDGLTIGAHIDFGTPALGSSSNTSHIEDVFFGMDTDGVSTLTVDVDGTPYTYPVVCKGDLARATLSRSVYGRAWNVAMDVSDASEFSLETVELHLSGTRRWDTKK